MGQTLSTILSKESHTVIGIDLHNRDTIDRATKRADLAILALPFLSATEYIQKFSDRITCVELTSVKTPMLKFSNMAISIHPLFGPRSFEEEDLRNIIFITDISPAGSIKLVKQLFHGFNVIEMTATEHDKLAAKVQVAPYLISILADLVNRKTDLMTRSKKILEMMAGVSIDQNSSVLFDTIARNPFSIGILKEIEEKIKQLGGELNDCSPDVRLKH